MPQFKLVTDYAPKGDQPRAIDALVKAAEAGARHQVLLGVTGSGKTFTMANVVARLQMPTLVIAHNKTLAAQLFSEFRSLFPENAVEYFISYYDYYQPEAYLPASDTYIEKDSSINDEIDKMRLSATRSLIERRDVLIVASVSCIYGIGSPEVFGKMVVFVREGDEMDRDDLLRGLVAIQYSRNDVDFSRGTFRVRGDTVEIFPAYESRQAIRVEFFGDEIEAIHTIDPLRGSRIDRLRRVSIYPATHYVVDPAHKSRAIESIKKELAERLEYFYRENKLVEAQRLESRTNLDLEMLQEQGFCHGIENYSRHLAGRGPGEPPYTLIDYFPEDFLMFVDESHQSTPQIGAMYRGDRSRKETLVEFGFRLPSALDNRPLEFAEWEERINRAIFVSATPADYELEKAGGVVVEQIIRPTGLIDPVLEVRPAEMQVDDLLGELRRNAEAGYRALVTTLTKRMAEELTEYYAEAGVRVRYLHSEIVTLERVEILRSLRLGDFDVLVGINLLREGLDLPEVALVAILDADKEGFLRSETSLVQTFGRAARNVDGRVILYADRVTGSMKRAIDVTRRRRKLQEEYNEKHGITPRSVKKNIDRILTSVYEADRPLVSTEKREDAELLPHERKRLVAELGREMREAAKALEFERAAVLRDRIRELREGELGI